VVLGAVQGPAELLPVSSSGHLVLLPELARSPYSSLDPELRKAFEVALHAGTAAALLVALRGEVAEVMRELDARRAVRLALTFAPAAAAALLGERVIEERASSPRVVAVAQIAAGAALWAADRRPATRGRSEAGELDHLVVGVAQAAALVPGVSRNGATLTAARLRRFSRPAAGQLSRHAALPVILGAAGLKGSRLARRGMPRGLAVPFAAGAGAAFCSTLASSRLLARVDEARSYAPFAAYRIVLGVASAVAIAARSGTIRP
jgi:undecaprenyl-diphosphatase